MIGLLAALLATSSVSNELSVGKTDTTAQNPRAGSVADALNGSIAVSDKWSLLLGAMVTVEGSTTRPSGTTQFADQGGTIGLFTVGADYEPNDSWVLGTTLDFSPQATTREDTQLTITGARGSTVDADGLLRTSTSTVSGQLNAAWNSGGDLPDDAPEPPVEYGVLGAVTVQHLSQDQQITSIRDNTGTTRTATEIRQQCKTSGKCTRALLAALRETPSTLDSAKLSLTGTLSFGADTDVGLGGDAWLYAQDPNEVGFFSVGAVGRTTYSGGNGVPIAPMSWQVRPEFTQRFGGFSLRLTGYYGQYATGGGNGTMGGAVKAQYKFSKAFRTWITVNVQRDVAADDSDSVSRGLALGAAYRF